MSDLGFTIEQRAGTDVVVYDDGSCHPATPDEVALWETLTAEREAFARYRDAAEQAAREDAARTMRAEADRDHLQAAVDAVRALADRDDLTYVRLDDRYGVALRSRKAVADMIRAALDEHHVTERRVTKEDDDE